ncbi:MAG: response regulator transcription factor [Armatimonadota bacterium]|nr:response regulator transcription factor [Armatimonadota bacterium]MDR5702255.1 response regulator transcription factor [Armatimonadota bacterium]
MRILLADDHPLFRDGIKSLLQARGMEVVGEANDGLEALEKTRQLQPDVVLMDIRMPRCSGLEATRLIKAEFPQVKIVILTVSDDDRDLFDAIKSGAQGYLLKNLKAEEFFDLLTSAARGEAVISRELAGKILEEFARTHGGQRPREVLEEELTEREKEVLQLVAGGATNKEIATSLGISENTVKFHMKNILDKLHLRNRAEAVAYAARKGLLRPPDS